MKTFTAADLARNINQARADYEAHADAITRSTLSGVLAAIGADLVEKLNDRCYGEAVAVPFADDDDVRRLLPKDPVNAFAAGRWAYTYIPGARRDGLRLAPFDYTAEYIALDGDGHLASIRNEIDLVWWYEGAIDDYFVGNYGDPDPAALEALADVFGGVYVDDEGVRHD